MEQTARESTGGTQTTQTTQTGRSLENGSLFSAQQGRSSWVKARTPATPRAQGIRHSSSALAPKIVPGHFTHSASLPFSAQQTIASTKRTIKISLKARLRT